MREKNAEAIKVILKVTAAAACLFSLANSLIFINNSFLSRARLATKKKFAACAIKKVADLKQIFSAAGEKLIGSSRVSSILVHEFLSFSFRLAVKFIISSLKHFCDRDS